MITTTPWHSLALAAVLAAAAPAQQAGSGRDEGSRQPAPAAPAAVFDERAAEAARAARRAAADEIEAALDRDDGDRADLLRAARAAARHLGGASRVGRHLAALSGEDPDALVRRLEQLADDLRFEVFEQAPLPVGFPPPAPVGEIVLKSYPGYRMARTAMRGGSATRPFWTLFRHIEEAEIAMTAPVQMDYDPMARDSRPRQRSMAFLYRRPDQGEAGAAGAVEVVDVPAGMAIGIGGRGRASPQRVAELTAALRAWLDRHAGAYGAAGPVRMMGYNDPMVPAARQFFEVEIPVRVRDGAPKRSAAL